MNQASVLTKVGKIPVILAGVFLMSTLGPSYPSPYSYLITEIKASHALAGLGTSRLSAEDFTQASALLKPIDTQLLPNTTIQLQPGEQTTIKATIRNNTATLWTAGNTKLVAVHPLDLTVDRISEFATPEWESQKAILAIGQTDIAPGQTAEWQIPLKAPARIGYFRETFVLHTSSQDFTQLPLYFNALVGSPDLSVEATSPQAIIIDRASQTARWIENGVIIATTLVSTGKSGIYETPSGRYTVFNHIQRFYSAKYGLWVENWMALNHEERGLMGVGLHALPYWKVPSAGKEDGQLYNGRLYEAGKLYEGFSHLGTKVSHGCIRFGLAEAKLLYDWAKEGAPVLVL